MVNKQTFGSRPTLGGMFLQHVIVFLICVVFPGAVTMMAPATWLKFERSGETVRCKTWSCMFFVVPFKIQQVDQVQEVTHRERASKTERQREFGRTTNKTVNVDGEGFLQIHGPADQIVEVSVSPASLKNVLRKVNEFINSTTESSTTIFAIANWKFGALMGGLLTLFTILYVVGYTLGFLQWIFTRVKKTT
jgi:regulator of protease activity HflC (stomatin/prohibitin superfamily)